jgi:sialic acid synthase SpsE
VKTIDIDGRLVGDEYPVYTIAEIGSNFDGSLQRAKTLINLAKDSGADAVKFQSFLAEKIISEKGFRGLRKGFQARWNKPVYEVYKNAEFPREWHEKIASYCQQVGITFFSAPYDKEAVDLLDSLNVPVFKIGSGDITWLEMIKYIAEKEKPIILGTGASTYEEIQDAVTTIRSVGNNDIVLLQCVTNYPSSYENANIRAMVDMKKHFDCLVGYSDHSPGFIVPLGMTALGGCVIEKHFTDDTTRDGPDHSFAMDANDFRTMVTNIRLLEKTLGSKKAIYNEEQETIILQRRCLRASKNIKEGTLLTREMIEVLRPSPKNSISPKHIQQLIGKRIKKEIHKDDHFTWDMIENGSKE